MTEKPLSIDDINDNAFKAGLLFGGTETPGTVSETFQMIMSQNPEAAGSFIDGVIQARSKAIDKKNTEDLSKSTK